MKIIHWLLRLRFNIAELFCVAVLCRFLDSGGYASAGVWFLLMLVFCPKAKDATGIDDVGGQ
ncbi:hypothetical protein EQW76_00635 [Rhizobium sp. rho-13.1]|uniref:hypothetical protein n=1 Tax=Rhizobium sp. rho-13.1 TaxID=2506431 RepID=UPI00115E8BE4|nr:hypothetical protein [Rhizobium sp. rho-13.1]TQX91280.1 hypothetical protein EQW76_00635 [Rhizobium sp. rho-13.1]